MSAARRWRRVLLSNAAMLALFALLGLGYFSMFARPERVNRAFPVALSDARAVGRQGEALTSAGLELTLLAAERLDALPYQDLPLSSRARAGALEDYVVLELRASNAGDTALALEYDGAERTFRFLLGSRRPQPQVALVALPQDAELIAGRAALPSKTLAPGESVTGVLLFALPHTQRDLSLLALPQVPRAAGALPAFEIALTG